MHRARKNAHGEDRRRLRPENRRTERGRNRNLQQRLQLLRRKVSLRPDEDAPGSAPACLCAQKGFCQRLRRRIRQRADEAGRLADERQRVPEVDRLADFRQPLRIRLAIIIRSTASDWTAVKNTIKSLDTLNFVKLYEVAHLGGKYQSNTTAIELLLTPGYVYRVITDSDLALNYISSIQTLTLPTK